MTKESAPLRPQKKSIKFINYGKGKCENGCFCDDENLRTEVKMDDCPESMEVHPLDDEMVDNEEAPEAGEEAVPPPPAHPEDVDGNWARPVRQRIQALPKPLTPTREDRERHRLTHIPYATWCRHCVACRGRNLPHRHVRPLPADSIVPVVSMDLAHVKRHDAEKKLPFIVVRDHSTKLTFAHLLQGKSTVVAEYSDYVVNAVLNDLRYLDHKKMILKSDQEKAMTALFERLRRLRNQSDEQTLEENSPVGESQSNGVVEEAIKEVEEMMATLLSSLEESLGGRLPQECAAVAWAVEYAAVVMNYFKVGADGMTALERHRGAKHERPLAEFGERVLYLPLDRKSHPVHAPEPRYEDGIWLGLDIRSTEVIIGTPSGVVKARSVRRRPEDERWSIEEVLRIAGTPDNPTPGISPEFLRAPVLVPPGVLDPGEVQPVDEPGLSARRAGPDRTTWIYTRMLCVCCDRARRSHTERAQRRLPEKNGSCTF